MFLLSLVIVHTEGVELAELMVMLRGWFSTGHFFPRAQLTVDGGTSSVSVEGGSYCLPWAEATPAFKCPTVIQSGPSPTQVITWSKMSIVLSLRNPSLGHIFNIFCPKSFTKFLLTK